MTKNFASLGFDLDDLVARKRLILDHVYIERSEIEETGEYDLEGLFIRLGNAIDSIGANLSEIEELRLRLEETEEVLRAIQNGEVDALVVSRPEGEQIFTLQGAEHPYRVLIETMNEGAATLDPYNTIVYCNSRLATMLQVPLEKLIGSALETYVTPEDYPLFAARLQSCTRDSAKEEITLITGAGNRIPVLFSCCAVEMSGRQGASVVLTDISARRQAENTILRLNRLYAVLSALNHAILHTNDREFIFREVCRVAVELGGFRLAWVGIVDKETGLVKVAAANGETGYLDGIRMSMGDPKVDSMGPTRTSIRNGTYYICNEFLDRDTCPWQERAHAHGFYASASVAIKHAGEVVGALTIYGNEKNYFDSQQVELLKQMGSDLSFALDNIQQGLLRRETEQALQKETMERLQAVEELRKNEQLLIQQSRLAALGEMIGNIAHQWRQPLNNLGLLVQQPPVFYELGEVNKEFLEQNASKATEYIQHMSRTIDDFRNFFKPDKEKVLFKVREEVEKTLSLVELGFKAHQICIDVEVKGDPVIHGYSNEFSQVLLNILMNARDALTEREIAQPKIVISVGTEDSRAIVTIYDNAGGIAEEIMDKIFDPYFTTKGPQAGTGVGLFMSKTIIEKNMGGHLTVRNVGGGAEFRIEV